MEKTGSGKQQRGLLLAELARVQELARQMEAELNLHFGNGPCHLLLQELLEATDKSISLVESAGHPVVAGEYLPLASGMQKKRKIMPKWTIEVRVDSGGAAGVELPVDDGCSWRKYGQKDILGTKHPRGYFRCKHRVTHGCPATKQVQRSDGDPLLFQVSYHGEHTCLQEAASPLNLGRRRSLDLLSSFQNGLQVETEDLELREQVVHGRTSDASCDFAEPTTPNQNNCGIIKPSPTLHSPAAGGAGGNSDMDLLSWDVDLMFQELDFDADFSSWFEFPSNLVN